MSHDIGVCYHAAVSGAIAWLFLLWVAGRFTRARPTLAVKLGLGAAAAGLCLLPFDGLALWRWLLGVWPNPSLPLAGLVVAALGCRLGGVTLLAPADRRVAWAFGAVVGTALYLHPMFPGAVDLYYWGWDGRVAALGMAVLATGGLIAGSRLGVLLLAALIAFAGGLLESPNAWDTLVDPFYWLIGLGVMAREAVRWALKRRPTGIGSEAALSRKP
jgi:hypothetical protein